MSDPEAGGVATTRGSRTSRPPPAREKSSPCATIATCHDWFAGRGWRPFDFQEQVWDAAASGASGLLHAPTGTGKTLAAWLGAVARSGTAAPATGAGPRVVWITPLRALAADTLRALAEPLGGRDAVVRGWTVDVRTGDTSAADRRRLRACWPTGLVTTPESLSVLLSLEDAHETFAALDTVIVDEWHELLSTKRGVQTELALARLRALRPHLVTWGLSATLANLDEALAALVGPARAAAARLVSARIP